MAVAEAKSGKDVRLYAKMVHALARVAPSEKEATVDREWVDETTKAVKNETERFEHELKGYKNNLIKESIRVRPDHHTPPRVLRGGMTDMGVYYRWETRIWATITIE